MGDEEGVSAFSLSDESILELVQKAADRYLPAACHSVEISSQWHYRGTDRGNEMPTSLAIKVERDMSPIDIDLDFGNYIYDKADLKRAARQALKHFPAAVDAMMREREELTIHSATVGFILLSGESASMRGWPSLQQHLAVALNRRTGMRINPRTLITDRFSRDKLEWQVHWPKPRQMRLPGKRILPGLFEFGEVSGSHDYLHIREKLPKAVLVKSTGQPVETIVDLPGFQHIKTRIRDHDGWGNGSRLHFTSETLNMEETFSLAAKILGS